MLDWKSARLGGCSIGRVCTIGRVWDWYSVKLEGCGIGIVQDWKSVGLEGCKIDECQ